MAVPPLVTVCIPTIGRVHTLRGALHSFRAQSYANSELLILDNACPADAQEIINLYVKEEPRARVLRSEQRLHMFANFSRGIDAAKGKYLTFFHDDDLYEPDFLQSHVSMLERNQEAGFSGSNCYVIDARDQLVGERRIIRRDDVWSGRRYIATLARLGVNVFPMQSVVFRRTALGASPFDESMNVSVSDFVILMRVAEQWDVALLTAPLMRMRVHEGQFSQRISSRDFVTLRTEVFNHYCIEFASRFPEERQFMQDLEASVSGLRLRGLLWGWLAAASAADAADCLNELGGSFKETLLRFLLSNSERAGLSFTARQKVLLPAVRRAGYALERFRSYW